MNNGKSNFGFSYVRNMANFEAFHWVISSSINLLFLKNVNENQHLKNLFFYFQAFCDEMGINPYDIVSTLQSLGMIKYWKGQHIILRKEDMIGTYLEKNKNRKSRQIYPNALKWKPYEPTARERKQAMNIKKNQEEKQKKR